MVELHFPDWFKDKSLDGIMELESTEVLWMIVKMWLNEYPDLRVRVGKYLNRSPRFVNEL